MSKACHVQAFHFNEMKITTPKTTLKTGGRTFLSYDHCENECHIEGMILENNEKSCEITKTFAKTP